MKYMLLMYGTERDWTDEERTACMIESLGVCDELASRGKYLAASPLQPVATAKTVRVRDDKALITAGPFAETTEQLGGYYVLDLEHLDEAIAVASKLPPVRKGTVEIRPLYPLENLPPARPLPADGGAAGHAEHPPVAMVEDRLGRLQRRLLDESAHPQRPVGPAARCVDVPEPGGWK